MCTNKTISTFFFWKFTASYLFRVFLFYTLLGADARREARKAFLAFSTDENMKETSDSLVSETEAETSLGPEFSEDIKISESTPVSQLSSFSLQTSFMLLIVIATGVIYPLVIFFLNFSSTFRIRIKIGL